MNPFHCSNCNKLLGKIDGKAEIKCPRCKTLNRGIPLHEYLSERLNNSSTGTVIPYQPGKIIRY